MHEVGIFLHIGELLFDALAQFLALLQGSPCCTGAFDMAPHQLIRIQIGCIAGQEVKGELAVHGLNVLAHDGLLVRRQTIKHQMHRFLRWRIIMRLAGRALRLDQRTKNPLVF